MRINASRAWLYIPLSIMIMITGWIYNLSYDGGLLIGMLVMFIIVVTQDSDRFDKEREELVRKIWSHQFNEQIGIHND